MTTLATNLYILAWAVIIGTLGGVLLLAWFA